MPLSKVIHRNYPCMNSVLDVVFTDIDSDLAENLFPSIWQLAARYERILSSFDPNSETYQLNKNAYSEFVPVSDALFEIILESIQFYKITKGYFDAGLKKLKSYSFLEEGPEVPIGICSIEVDEKRKSVRFLNDKTALDFGGAGKGILLREIAKKLAEHSVNNCFISFGGSSILTRGNHPHGCGWPVSLRDDSPDYTFHLQNHAASISESQPRGREISHIINPKSQKPLERRLLSFVVADDPLLAEVLSTAFLIAPLEEVKEIILSVRIIKAFIFERTPSENLISLFSAE